MHIHATPLKPFTGCTFAHIHSRPPKNSERVGLRARRFRYRAFFWSRKRSHGLNLPLAHQSENAHSHHTTKSRFVYRFHTKMQMQIHSRPPKTAKKGELRVRWFRLSHIVNIYLISEFIIFTRPFSSRENVFTA